jgi:hypothetical protein
LKEEVLKDIVELVRKCSESGDSELILVSHLLKTIVISYEKKELPYLSDSIHKWIKSRLGEQGGDTIDIKPPSPN